MAFPDARLSSGREVVVNFADFGNNAPDLNPDALAVNSLAKRAGLEMRVAGEHAPQRRGKHAASASAEKCAGQAVGLPGATVSQADGNTNDKEVRLERGDRTDVGQTLNADWLSAIFPRNYPSGFAAASTEEAHGFNLMDQRWAATKKSCSDQEPVGVKPFGTNNQQLTDSAFFVSD
jgi:hypothetical protein